MEFAFGSLLATADRRTGVGVPSTTRLRGDVKVSCILYFRLTFVFRRISHVQPEHETGDGA